MTGSRITIPKPVKCKHGVELGVEKSCPMCKSLWEDYEDAQDQEAYELENFFRHGIETIVGQRGRIKELEKQLERALNQSPVVTCAFCNEPMGTVQSRVRDVSGPFGLTEQLNCTEVKYVCQCDRPVWVAKLKGLV